MQVVQSYFGKWLDKRIPAASKHKLNHQSIFIFPSKFGWLFLVLCLLLFLLGTNYQNNLMLILCYFLLAVFLVHLLASYINFARIDLQVGKCPEVFVGDNLHLPLWLNAEKLERKPPHGVLHFNFQDSLATESSSGSVVDADAYTNPVSLSHTCHQRGKLSLSRVTVRSFYPLGLFKCWTHLAFSNDVIVFTKPLPCEVKLETTHHSSNKKSGEASSHLSGHDDFSHLKAYQLGEPLHHVAWKQLAKGRGMVSEQFSTLENQIGWLKLPADLRGNNAQNKELEDALSRFCYQVIELSRQSQTFGLDLGQSCITPNNGCAHREACLKALALYPNGQQIP